MEQALLNPSTSPVFSENRVARSLIFYVMFCSSLFVLFYFFFWSLYCLSFFDLLLLMTPLVSSNVSLLLFTVSF